MGELRGHHAATFGAPGPVIPEANRWICGHTWSLAILDGMQAFATKDLGNRGNLPPEGRVARVVPQLVWPFVLAKAKWLDSTKR